MSTKAEIEVSEKAVEASPKKDAKEAKKEEESEDGFLISSFISTSTTCCFKAQFYLTTPKRIWPSTFAAYHDD